MNNELDTIATFEELWEWCRNNRKSAWRFPEKWGVRGYLGSLPLGIVADVPAPRSQEHFTHGLPYANDVDVFTTAFDRRLYRFMLKHGLENAHLMDTHISIVEDDDQDKRVFLKQVELGRLEALLIMGGPNSKVWKTVQRYLKHWNGTQPRMYKIWHYTYRFPSDEEWENVFKSALEKVGDNHPTLRTFLRMPPKLAPLGSATVVFRSVDESKAKGTPINDTCYFVTGDGRKLVTITEALAHKAKTGRFTGECRSCAGVVHTYRRSNYGAEHFQHLLGNETCPLSSPHR